MEAFTPPADDGSLEYLQLHAGPRRVTVAHQAPQ